MMKALVLLLAFVVWPIFCRAEDVLLIDHSRQSSAAVQHVELACRFYGLELRRLSVEESGSDGGVVAAIRRSEADAIIFETSVLAYLDYTKVSSAIFQTEKRAMLFVGSISARDSLLLRRWSGGALLACGNISAQSSENFCKVAPLKRFGRELAGQRMSLPLNVSRRITYFVLDQRKTSQTILQIENTADDFHFPIFVKVDIDGREVFWSMAFDDLVDSEIGGRQFTDESFLEVAPTLIFLRYALGERCWHRNRDDANFCIDDPWLTEPYGHLSYPALLQEMERANFHTTIAFIPWNFDRSDPAVASLFKNNPDRFSISLHGNNHDHREFNESRLLVEQEADIQQGLARMKELSARTGIAYDRVMIFPHHIAPEKTLGLLKKYNFLATVNGENIPPGSIKPDDLYFSLRPLLLQFENFLSLKRYSPQRSELSMAIDLFLDNPLLFYTHQDFFENGINAFNHTAETVNRLQPDAAWRSLGDLVGQLYYERKRADGHYDVLSFCNEFVLENRDEHTATFFVAKEESNFPSITQFMVDGQPHSYEWDGKYIMCKVVVPSGAAVRVSLEYENATDLSTIEISKKDLRVAMLRRLSDFRDMTLSTSAIGLAVVGFYYQSGLHELGLVNLFILIVVLFGVATRGGRKLQRYFTHFSS